MKKISTSSIFILVFSCLGYCGWLPTGGKEVYYVIVADNMAACSPVGTGEGWVSFGFEGDQYNYAFRLTDHSLGKSMLASLYYAQGNGKKIMADWDGSQDCGGNRIISRIQIVPQ